MRNRRVLMFGVAMLALGFALCVQDIALDRGRTSGPVSGIDSGTDSGIKIGAVQPGRHASADLSPSPSTSEPAARAARVHADGRADAAR